MNRFLFDWVRDILYTIACTLPLNRKIWIYGAWYGTAYSDNSKYLFEYMSLYHPEITSVWLTRKRSVVRQIRRLGYRAHVFYSPIGLWYGLRSGLAIFCCGYSVDLPAACMSPRKLYVQLWHGVGPKKVGALHDPSAGKKQDTGRPAYEGDRFDRYDYFFTLSLLTKRKVIDMFAVSQRKQAHIAVTGYPRNDALYRSPAPKTHLSDLIHSVHAKGGKIGVYMPTHRSEGKTKIATGIAQELRRINPALAQHNLYLLVKLHPFHLREMSHLALSHVHLINERDIASDIYPYLSLTDFLVTDYSSIYIDYLLLDKPIFFLTTDIVTYRANERDFYFDYDKVTPGPKVRDWQALIPTVVRELQHDQRKKARAVTRNMFHAHADGSSSQRVAEVLMRILSVS